MDILSLEKLMEQTKIIESISETVIDDKEYNVVTKRHNPSALTENINTPSILAKGNDLVGGFDFKELENITKALNEADEPAPAPTQPAPTQPAKIAIQVTFEDGSTLKTNFVGDVKAAQEFFANKTFQFDGTDATTKSKEVIAMVNTANSAKPAPQQAQTTPAPAPQPVAKTESASNPSQGVVSASAFTNAQPVDQIDFVLAKTNSTVGKKISTVEDKVTEHKTDKSVEKQADSVLKDSQKGADKNKKFDDSCKGKNELDKKLKTFEKFVTSIKQPENKAVVESILAKIKSL